MKDPKRFSLAVKVNMVIMALVLSVSILLTLISENAYQAAVFKPYFRKLENLEFQPERMKLLVQQFRPYLGTEELNQVISENDSDEHRTNSALLAWFLGKPSVDEPPMSLMDDWMEFEILMCDSIQKKGDFHEVSCFTEKNGNLYAICTVLDNEDYMTSSFGDFGRQLPEGGPAASDYLTPKYLQQDGKTLLIRFIPLAADDGGQTWFRLNYDLTEELREHSNFLLRCVLLTLGVTLLASVVTGLVMRRFVLRPVHALAQATREFVPEEDGTYSPEKISRVEIRNRDEIGDLSRDIRAMQENIVTNTENLARMTAERERAGAELELAARIQEDALPNVFPAFPDHPEFDIFASMTPAKEVGGDFYDFFLIDKTHLGIVMADVSDKGVPAALFMMSAKTLIRSFAKTGMSPAQVMQAVNEQIRESNHQFMFVTVWFGILDLAAGRITSVNAGHEFPALMPAGGHFDLVRDKPCYIVGVKAGICYREQEISLAPGAKIFLYTDGVPEAQNAAGEMFGTKRMVSALNAGRGDPPEGILRIMKEAVAGFVQDAAQFDDLTMLCLEYRGPAVS